MAGEESQQAVSPVGYGRIPPAREYALLAALLAYACVLWFWGLGRSDLVGSMESRRAAVTAAMLRDGDFVTLRVGEDIYLAKPALFYWIAAGYSKLSGHGVTAASMRGTSALCAILAVLFVYFAVRPTIGNRAALLAALVCVATPMVYDQAVFADVNTLLALGVAVSLLSLFRMLEPGRRTAVHAALCGAGVAIGVLAKGPVLLMFFVPTALLYAGFLREDSPAWNGLGRPAFLAVAAGLVWLATILAKLAPAGALLFAAPALMLLYFGLRGGRRTIGRGRDWLIVLAVALLLVLPWPVLLAHRITPGVMFDTLKEEIWNARIASVDHVNREPLWFYLFAFPGATLPFALFIPQAFSRAAAPAGDSARRLMLLAKCWLLGSLVFFSVSTPAKETRYVLPLFPALAILAASVLDGLAGGTLERKARRYASAVGTGVLVCVCALPVVLPAVWVAKKLPWGPEQTLMVALSIAASGGGLLLNRLRPRPLNWLPAFMAALLAVKILVQFGESEMKSRRDSFRAGAEELLKLVPPGATLYVTGSMRACELVYLGAAPLRPDFAPAAPALSKEKTIYVTVEAPDGASRPDLPEGFKATVLGSVRYREADIELLRLDRVERRRQAGTVR